MDFSTCEPRHTTMHTELHVSLIIAHCWLRVWRLIRTLLEACLCAPVPKKRVFIFSLCAVEKSYHYCVQHWRRRCRKNVIQKVNERSQGFFVFSFHRRCLEHDFLHRFVLLLLVLCWGEHKSPSCKIASWYWSCFYSIAMRNSNSENFWGKWMILRGLNEAIMNILSV